MALTADGLQRIWQIAAGVVDDSIVGGRVRVTDGDAEASVEIFTAPIEIEEREDGPTAVCTVTATFGESEGVFTWNQIEVRTREGIVLDRSPVDQGMKVIGSEWTVRLSLALKP